MKKGLRGGVSFIGWCGAAAVLLLAAGIWAAGAAGAADQPGVRTLGSISEKYAPVRFDHPKHAMIAGDCAACHHQHQAGKNINCGECHALGPSAFKSSVKSSFLACSACHGAYDPATPSVPGLKVAYHKQCFQCHRGMGNIGSDPKGCTEICHAKKQVKLGMRSAQ